MHANGCHRPEGAGHEITTARAPELPVAEKRSKDASISVRGTRTVSAASHGCAIISRIRITAGKLARLTGRFGCFMGLKHANPIREPSSRRKCDESNRQVRFELFFCDEAADAGISIPVLVGVSVRDRV